MGEVGCSSTMVGAGRAGAGVEVGGLPVQPESPASRTMLIKTINATIYSSKIIRDPEMQQYTTPPASHRFGSSLPLRRDSR